MGNIGYIFGYWAVGFLCLGFIMGYTFDHWNKKWRNK